MTDRKFFILSIVVSVLVFCIVLFLNIIPKPENTPSFARFLPGLNATINGTCSVLLILSLYFIRKKNVLMHKRINMSAFFLSCIFLVSYILYHYFSEETKFPSDNFWRPAYLIILLTHILLASLILPFILMSFYRGLNNQVEKHKKIVRWTYPIWLYVTITGVVIYLMISPHYPS